MDKNMRKRVVKLLRKTADNIKKYGWTKNTYGDKSKGFCVAGALIAAQKELKTEGNVYFKADKALDQQLRMDYNRMSYISWNDQQRDKRKVIRFIERTARNVESGKLS